MGKRIISKKRVCLFTAYTIFIAWYTLLKRETRGAERVCKPELFWEMRTWIENLMIVSKVAEVQYLMNILFFIPYSLRFQRKITGSVYL